MEVLRIKRVEVVGEPSFITFYKLDNLLLSGELY
jgi:hypothetical protein